MKNDNRSTLLSFGLFGQQKKATLIGVGLVHASMTDDTPLYLQVEARLRQGLAIGTWPADQALPPERQLAEEIGVSRRTLRKALERLEEAGALVRKRGSGTYAASLTAPEDPLVRLSQAPQTLTSFTEEMHARGMSVTTKWLVRETTAVTPDEAFALAISPRDRVARLKRIRYANKLPVCIEHTVLPAEFVPDPHKIHDSLYAYLDATNARPVRALQHITALFMPAEEAEVLMLSTKEPALFTRRVTYHANGHAIEFTRGYYHASRYEIVVETGGR